MTQKKMNFPSGLLQGTRVYLSGPMDFVASRAAEKKYGWRNRVGEFLRHLGVTVFDPWNKPRVRGLQVRGLYEYGREDIGTTRIKEQWTFEESPKGSEARAYVSGKFWETMHIDLRMVDTTDFTIAYCPTNIYSVGTVHEIVLCRQQRKPVLFVSPRITFSALENLRKHLEKDTKGTKLIEKLINEIPIKENPQGIPSLWYMTLVGGENFFDGFGFEQYKAQFRWKHIPLDDREGTCELKRPLLPFLENLSNQLPKKWDNRQEQYVRNDDFLLWDLKHKKDGTTEVSQTRVNQEED